MSRQVAGMDYATTLLSKIPGSSYRPDKGLPELVETLQGYMPEEQVEKVVAAYEYGARAHRGQTRMSGVPYIQHPVAVARILADMHLDGETIAAAILHDVIEDTEVDLGELSERFGEEVAALVDGVSKLDRIRFNSRAEAQAESFRKMMLAMIEDIRVILVKLADRLHNMRTLDAMPRSKQRRIAAETLEIYAPIANRLGMNQIKVELEDLGMRYLYPYRYRVIDRALKRRKSTQRQSLKKISERIEKALADEGIEGSVRSREKRLFSIYKKMSEKKRLLEEVADVYGIRIIVDSVDDCYRVLGIVHGLYKPMPGRFKDYVAIPRMNGYQSLHTTLFGPKGMPLEVQIRTTEMDQVAESGVAAHWQYKAQDKTTATPQIRARQWLARLDEIEKSGSSEEFLESVKVDLFPDKIYVFTPKGEIMPMPKGATVVDFAYAVHTDVGNRCVSAKIDRNLVPLRTVLENGQTVEIITARDAKPNPNWVTFVTTAKARSAIRSFMRSMVTSESVDLGRRLLDRALKDIDSSLRKVGKVRMREVLDELGIASNEALFEQIGLGERLAPVTARLLVDDKDGNADHGKVPELVIAGTEGMVVSYAKCCHPIPGDEIMGYLSAGRGVVVHRNKCGNMINFRKHPEKWLTVSWEQDIDRDFLCQINVDTVNRTGVLAEVAATIADSGSNIEHVSVNNRDDDTTDMNFVLSVKDRNHLARIIRNVRKMSNVTRVHRDLT
ncbi:MAG: bifunctional (p)ppGpp synthetase/guanosine-3',5'-bis(diphosphate) 3'-pyrophosphohydrolase [Woeseiaceae bacterium]|nr:bifunctional (p)ppGpp synthetase/guanosine-3',5'-bis(diphosphate) 3'-pyrophosphohydrolase [Woeseiaceae bacterium]